MPDGANSAYRLSTMTGLNAARTVIVSGPGSVAISTAEKDKVVSEMIAGCKFWTDRAPSSANLKFQVLYNHVTISTPNTATNCKGNVAKVQQCEDVFVNPALQALGYSTGQAGRDAMKKDSVSKWLPGAKGAFLSFFTKYNLYHIGYAKPWNAELFIVYGGPRNYAPDDIDKVFAHETGHIYNAPDEYVSSMTQCDCGTHYGKGTCSSRNTNCVTCPGSKTTCIMKHVDWTICPYTRKHLGWC